MSILGFFSIDYWLCCCCGILLVVLFTCYCVPTVLSGGYLLCTSCQLVSVWSILVHWFLPEAYPGSFAPVRSLLVHWFLSGAYWFICFCLEPAAWFICFCLEPTGLFVSAWRLLVHLLLSGAYLLLRLLFIDCSLCTVTIGTQNIGYLTGNLPFCVVWYSMYGQSGMSLYSTPKQCKTSLMVLYVGILVCRYTPIPLTVTTGTQNNG